MHSDFKIKKISAADLVCDKVKALIAGGTWPAGNKIPPEVELAENFGVNRLTVRIALQRLHALGLLDIRVGDGTYVKDFDLSAQISELSEFYVNSKTVQDVVEYRLALELSCVEMAVERRTLKELEHFHKLCLRFQEELRQHYALADSDPAQAQDYFLKTVDTSADLHMALCAMTHNDLMVYACSLAREPMKRHMQLNASRRLQDRDPDGVNVWSKRWLCLYDSLTDRDADTCARVLSLIIDS